MQFCGGAGLKFPKVFYGWWVVAASTIVALYAGGGIFYGFTALFEPIVADLGWSYTQVSLASSLRGLESGILAPLVGFLADRLGPRKLSFAGGVFGAAGLLLLSQTNSLVTFYSAFVLLAIGVSACTTNVLMVAVTNWFHRRVGTASGVLTAGFGAGGLMIPCIVWLIDASSWRQATLILGFGMAAVVLPLSLVLRQHPEQYGYLPDGEPVTGDGRVHKFTPPPRPPVQYGKMLRERTFWYLTVMFIIQGTILTAIVTHVMPYLGSVGITRTVGGLVATGIPLVSIAGRLSFGFLSDRFARNVMAAVAFGMMTVGTILFAFVSVSSVWVLIPFLLLFSIGAGGINVARTTLVRQYYGRMTFGTIFGVISGVGMLGQVGGPVLGGWVFDQWANYRPLWLAFAVFSVVATVIVWRLPRAGAKLREGVPEVAR